MAASGILREMSIVLSGEISGFQKAMATAKKELAGFVKAGEALKDVGTSLLPLSGVLSAVGLGSVKLAGDLEKANVNFEVMLGSAEKATAVLKDLKDFAASTPFEFPEVQDAAKKLLAFNTPAEELKDTLRQLGDVSAGIDAPIGEIAELFGKARVQGRLFQEDINQLTGRGIPIIQELAKQFKVSDSEVRKLVETGKVGFPNLQQAFADLTGEGGKFSGLMEKQSQTLPGLISTVMDTIKGFAADFGTEIIAAFDLKGALKNFIAFAESLRESFAALDPSTKKLILGIGALAIAIGPLLVGIGTLLTILPTLKVAFLTMTGPIGLTVAAIALAATLIIANWDEIVAYFTTGDGGRVFKDLSQSVTEAMATIRDAFSQLDFAGDTLGDLVGITDILKEAFQSLASGISGIADTVNGMVRLVTGALNGDWTKAWDAAKQIVLGIYGPLANLLGLDYGKFKDFLGVQGDGGKSGVSQYFAGLTRNVGGFLAVAPFATAAVKDFKDAADKPTPPLVNEEQVKTLASLREALRLNEQNSLALGSAYEFISGKASALKSGIQDLLKAGFAPGSAIVQGFVAQLNAIPVAFEQIQTRLSQGIAAPKIEEAQFAFKTSIQPPKIDPFDTKNLDNSVLYFENTALKIQDTIANLELPPLPPLPAFDATPLQDSFTGLQAVLVDAGAAVQQGLSSIIASSAAAFGEVLATTGSVGDALQATFGAILQGMAAFAVQFGQLLIAQGTAVLLAKSVAANPVAAIAAGAALVAIGSAAGALLKKGPKLTGGGGGGTPSASATPTASRTPTATMSRQETAIQNNTAIIQLTLDGREITRAVELQFDRQGRVLGGR